VLLFTTKVDLTLTAVVLRSRDAAGAPSYSVVVRSNADTPEEESLVTTALHGFLGARLRKPAEKQVIVAPGNLALPGLRR